MVIRKTVKKMPFKMLTIFLTITCSICCCKLKVCLNSTFIDNKTFIVNDSKISKTV